MQRGYDQVVHDVVIQKLPVRMILDRAGLVGNDGPTHHGSFDLSYMGILPNIVIMAPSDEVELVNMIETAYETNDLPSVVRYPRGQWGIKKEIGWMDGSIDVCYVCVYGCMYTCTYLTFYPLHACRHTHHNIVT